MFKTICGTVADTEHISIQKEKMKDKRKATSKGGKEDTAVKEGRDLKSAEQWKEWTFISLENKMR